MTDIHVMIVPQKGVVEMEALRYQSVYIDKALGRPNLEHYNCKYIVPFWMRKRCAAKRIFKIEGKPIEHEDSYEIKLGASFELPELLVKSRSHRRLVFEPLYRFKLIELLDGVLTSEY